MKEASYPSSPCIWWCQYSGKLFWLYIVIAGWTPRPEETFQVFPFFHSGYPYHPDTETLPWYSFWGTDGAKHKSENEFILEIKFGSLVILKSLIDGFPWAISQVPSNFLFVLVFFFLNKQQCIRWRAVWSDSGERILHRKRCQHSDSPGLGCCLLSP